MRHLHKALLILTVFAIAITAFFHPIAAAICAVALAGAHLEPVAMMGTPTLILALLTRKVIAAFRSAIIELSFFSVDWGLDSGKFAMPAKWQQEVISQMAIPGTVSDHVPGADLEATSANPKDELVDVKVKMDRCKKVVKKILASDLARLDLNAALTSSMSEGAKDLGREIVADILSYAIGQNFSQSNVEPAAGFDYDTLDAATGAMNLKGVLTPRFLVGGTTPIRNIALDTRVFSRDFMGIQQGADPYVRISNMCGFTEIREFPNFPANPIAGTFTAATTDLLTLTQGQGVPPLNNGDRVQVSSATTLPAGLVAATDYYVVNADTDALTCKLSATLGGAAVDITDTGTGVHTIKHATRLNAFAFEKRAIHVCFRQMLDASEVADELGIPKLYKVAQMTDEESGLAFTAFMWQKQNTHDIYIAFVAMYGIRAGRGLYGGATPGTQAAGTALDYAGLLIQES